MHRCCAVVTLHFFLTDFVCIFFPSVWLSQSAYSFAHPSSGRWKTEKLMWSFLHACVTHPHRCNLYGYIYLSVYLYIYICKSTLAWLYAYTCTHPSGRPAKPSKIKRKNGSNGKSEKTNVIDRNGTMQSFYSLHPQTSAGIVEVSTSARLRQSGLIDSTYTYPSDPQTD